MSPLSDPERAWITERLEAARRFVGSFSPGAGESAVTLEALDRAWGTWIDQGKQDTAEINDVINGVGIQFGQLLVEHAGFQWIIASDRHGTDLAVLALPGEGNVLVYPANFVAKRWERREREFLVSAFQAIQTDVVRVSKAARSAEHRPWWKFW